MGDGKTPTGGSVPVSVDDTMRALRSRTRREILALVWDRELAAGQIAAEFKLRPATISEHLSVLRAAGLVTMTPIGTSRRYRARQEALDGLHGALDQVGKWTPATGLPERELAQADRRSMVSATVRLPFDPDTTFGAFVDPVLFSRWLQVPVQLIGDRFAATMEWGTEVRGRYEIAAPLRMVVMTWDFEDRNVPLPGRPLTGYLRVHPDGAGALVQVHQVVDTPAQAHFMEVAWGMVLGRLAANLATALDPAESTARRERRPKV